MARIKDERTGRFIVAQSNAEKFYEKVKFIFETGCLEWIAYRDRNNYGMFTIRDNGKQRTIFAHRFSWELYNAQKVPIGLYVLHKCDNPPCVNPRHLFLGTQKDNIQDMIKKGRRNYDSVRGENHPRSKLTKSDVLEIRGLYNRKKFNQTELGKMFNVSSHQIGMIISHKSWSHI